jgi:hypothetical protein
VENVGRTGFQTFDQFCRYASNLETFVWGEKSSANSLIASNGMNNMLRDCTSVTSVDFTGLKLPDVLTVWGVVCMNTPALTSFDFSVIDTNNVHTYNFFFWIGSSVHTIDFGGEGPDSFYTKLASMDDFIATSGASAATTYTTFLLDAYSNYLTYGVPTGVSIDWQACEYYSTATYPRSRLIADAGWSIADGGVFV